MQSKNIQGHPVPKPADEIIRKMRLVHEEKTDAGHVIRRHYELDGKKYMHRLTDGMWVYIPAGEPEK